MKNDVSHAHKLLKLIFPDLQKRMMPDPENQKSRNFFLQLYLDEREYFLKISAKLVKQCLKNRVFPDFWKIWIPELDFFAKIQISPAVPEEIGLNQTIRQTFYYFLVLIAISRKLWTGNLKHFFLNRKKNTLKGFFNNLIKKWCGTLLCTSHIHLHNPPPSLPASVLHASSLVWY